jgi:hypothetical protein
MVIEPSKLDQWKKGNKKVSVETSFLQPGSKLGELKTDPPGVYVPVYHLESLFADEDQRLRLEIALEAFVKAEFQTNQRRGLAGVEDNGVNGTLRTGCKGMTTNIFKMQEAKWKGLC